MSACKCDGRECEVCHRLLWIDDFPNPHAQICESCYRAAGVDVWGADDDA